MNVLVIDTDRSTLRLLRRFFPKAGFQIWGVEHNGAIEAIEDGRPDILLLEHGDLCAHIRHHWPMLPIIVLLDDTQEPPISQILDSGADDCVMKPFSPAELGARMRAHVRRSQAGILKEASLYYDLLSSDDGYIRMCVSRRQLCVGDRQVHLTKIEFDLLRELMGHAGKVLIHRVLLQRIWGEHYGDEAEYLRVYIRQLRCKIEPHSSKPQYILTALGIGYVFRTPSTVAPCPVLPQSSFL